MTIRIDYVSDLHLDHHWNRTKLYSPIGPQNKDENGDALYFDWNYYKNQNKQPGNVLVIAGDTSNSVEFTLTVIKQAAKVYENVVFVDGNHEHYNRIPYSENIQRFRDELSNLYSIHYLCQDTPYTVIDRVAFVGACGWYDWRCYEPEGLSAKEAREDWLHGLNDDKIMFDKGDPEAMAFKDTEILAKTVSYLQDDVNDEADHIVMVTHTSPRREIMEISRDPNWNRLTPSFVNTQMKDVLVADTKSKIKYWIYGHTHFRKQTKINNIVYMNNAYGYSGEFPNQIWSLKQFEL